MGTYDATIWLKNNLSKLYSESNEENNYEVSTEDFQILNKIKPYAEDLLELGEALYDISKRNTILKPEDIIELVDTVIEKTHGYGISNAQQQTTTDKSPKAKKESSAKTRSLHSRSANKLNGRTFVFSGFTDSDLEQKITKRGGVVKKNIVLATTDLIAKDKNASSAKIKTAKEKNLNIYSIDEFKQAMKF